MHVGVRVGAGVGARNRAHACIFACGGESESDIIAPVTPPHEPTRLPTATFLAAAPAAPKRGCRAVPNSAHRRAMTRGVTHICPVANPRSMHGKVVPREAGRAGTTFRGYDAYPVLYQSLLFSRADMNASSSE